MWSSLDLFRDILPCCDVCKNPFDGRAHSPQTLPCGHTFGLKCLDQDKKKKKRKCPRCSQKFKSFNSNYSFADVIERVNKRKSWAEENSKRCDECDVRYPMWFLRRCHTCECGINQHIAVGFMECLLCLECCVNRHNGHDLTSRLQERKTISLVVSNPRGFSTPKTDQRPVLPHHMALKQHPVLSQIGLKSGPVAPDASRPPSHKRGRNVLPSAKKDGNKNVVVQCESSPLYLPTSCSPQRKRKWSSRLAVLKKRWSYTSDEALDRDSRSSGVVSDEYRSDPETVRGRVSVKERHSSDSVTPRKNTSNDTVRSCCTDPNMSYAYIAT